ncbi:vWA domain-containing protein [Geomonas anaerohicana]|uniref:VWA domain-containing protein n=1 Tax=Geomonas anaerohicana TaxID=2798583 RepID=A0ABS0YHL5_9BACT|nr:vWA domain-containing protein [Geomonas anaerohicana]MBJ6751634.1 VWA domain-containing protein [Geomonas anaerohicana]
MRCRPRGDNGQVVVGFAAAAVFLLAMIGLAIDLGMAYLVKTKLSAAVDAAALAAGRVVGQGESAANAEAAKFFAVNYPEGLLGASVAIPSTTFRYDDKEKSWEVTVRTTATAPAYFAKVVGRNTFTVGASGTVTTAPVDLVLVLDTSGTMKNPNVSVLESLKSAARNFLTYFNPNNDRIGLIRFASGVEEDFKITGKRGFNSEKMQELLGSNQVQASGYTTAEEALRCAKQQLDSIPRSDQSRQRIIVFFTDGAPNGVAATFATNAGPKVGVVSSQGDKDPEAGDKVRLEHLYRADRVNSDLKPNGGQLDATSLATLPATDWTGTVNLASYNNARDVLPYVNPDDLEAKKCNVNRAARNMTENIANAARSESGEQGNPITIFTIGLGAKLTDLELRCPEYGSSENGENIMKRLANVPGGDTYNSSQPSGIYAFARDQSQLNAAFHSVVMRILRLSK